MKRRSSLGISLLLYIALSVSYGEAQKGGRCSTLGIPDEYLDPINNPGLELNSLSGLSPVYQGEFGRGVQIRQVSGVTGVSYILVVTSGTVPTVYVFLLKQDGTLVSPNPIALTIPTDIGGGTRYMPEIGDVNGDTIPDIAIASLVGEPAYVFLGQLLGGVLGYLSPVSLTVPVGEAASRFGTSMAMGNLDGIGGDEVVIGAPGGGSGRSAVVGKVFIYTFNESGFVSQTLNSSNISPPLKTDDEFGRRVAIGDVTGSLDKDLIVGAPRREVGSVTDAGAVFVFSGPLLALSSTLTASSAIKYDNIGYAVAAGNLNGVGIQDVIATTSWGTATTRAVWAPGAISTGPTFTNDFLPYPGALSKGWATSGVAVANINNDGGLDDVLIGAPNASDCTNSVGAVHIYLSGNSPNPTILQPPTLDPDWGAFGWSVSAVAAVAPAPTVPPTVLDYKGLVVVGEPGRNLGSVSSAGQVYVYKYQPLPPLP